MRRCLCPGPAAGGRWRGWPLGGLWALVIPCLTMCGAAGGRWRLCRMGRFAASYGPFCNAERPVSCCRTACVSNPLALSYFAPRGAELCVAWRQKCPAGLRCSGRRLASVGRACTAGLGETGVMQGVGAYSGNARLPACIKRMSVGLAVAWRLVAMAASVCPAWNIERRLNIFFPAPCPAFD